MSNHSIKFKGRLRFYLCAPLYLSILLVLLNIPCYFYNRNLGVCMTLFTGVYTITMFVLYFRCKPLLVNELINFATQYGTVQKKLLNEFEIAYALVDYNGIHNGFWFVYSSPWWNGWIQKRIWLISWKRNLRNFQENLRS